MTTLRSRSPLLPGPQRSHARERGSAQQSYLLCRSVPPHRHSPTALCWAWPRFHTHLAEHCLPHRDIVLTIERWNGGEVARYLSSFDRGEFDQNGRPPGFDILNRRSSRDRIDPASIQTPWSYRTTSGNPTAIVRAPTLTKPSRRSSGRALWELCTANGHTLRETKPSGDTTSHVLMCTSRGGDTA